MAVAVWAMTHRMRFWAVKPASNSFFNRAGSTKYCISENVLRLKVPPPRQLCTDPVRPSWHKARMLWITGLSNQKDQVFCCKLVHATDRKPAFPNSKSCRRTCGSGWGSWSARNSQGLFDEIFQPVEHGGVDCMFSEPAVSASPRLHAVVSRAVCRGAAIGKRDRAAGAGFGRTAVAPG